MNSLLRRLEWPDHPVDVVLDTDTFNEIDDQFALAYLLCSGEKLRLQAIYAAPFQNRHASDPKQGMERSFSEILKILALMKRTDLVPLVCKGSEGYLEDENSFRESQAARDLVRRAMQHTPENPLYVIAIAAITNVASAIRMEPAIVDRIVIVWLGGNALHWPDNREFNLFQDVAAARIVFGCGAALVQLPCMGVVSAFTTTKPELEYWLRGKNALCDYLVDVTCEEAAACNISGTWSRSIWDVTAVGWLIDPSFTSDYLMPSPIPQYDHHFSTDPTRHPIRYVYSINRDLLFRDLFKKIAGASGGSEESDT